MCAADEIELSRIVEHALSRELETRRALRPHAQLAIAPDADLQHIERAYAHLRGAHCRTLFLRHGPEAVAAAEEISALIEAARASMRRHAEASAPRAPGRWSRFVDTLFHRHAKR